MVALISVLALSAALSAPLALAADASAEAAFVSSINSSRSANGLAALVVHGDLVSYARDHADVMAAEGTIFHSSDLGSATSGWLALGENVGMGPNVATLHQAFMDSTGHRANILGDYTHVGIGVSYDENGIMYVTEVFMKSSTPATTTTTAPPTTTTTAAATPPPTTTTTVPTTDAVPTRAAPPPVRRASTRQFAPTAIQELRAVLHLENPGAATEMAVVIHDGRDQLASLDVGVSAGGRVDLDATEALDDLPAYVAMRIEGPADVDLTLRLFDGEQMVDELQPTAPIVRSSMNGTAAIWNPAATPVKLDALTVANDHLQQIEMWLDGHEVREVTDLLLVIGERHFYVSGR